MRVFWNEVREIYCDRLLSIEGFVSFFSLSFEKEKKQKQTTLFTCAPHSIPCYSLFVYLFSWFFISFYFVTMSLNLEEHAKLILGKPNIKLLTFFFKQMANAITFSFIKCIKLSKAFVTIFKCARFVNFILFSLLLLIWLTPCLFGRSTTIF